jgi:hypothetical protein
MGDVVALKRPRKQTIRGASRQSLTEAFSAIKYPSAVVIVVLGNDGTYAMRSARVDDTAAFDIYSRAGAIMDRQRMELLDD